MSSYKNSERKPGTGILFVNRFKSAPNQPDYSGRIVTESGEECVISAWIKQNSDGKQFLSLSVKPEGTKFNKEAMQQQQLQQQNQTSQQPQQHRKQSPPPPPLHQQYLSHQQAPPPERIDDDDLPF